MSNFRPIDRDTGFLLPPSVDEWLPERHLARFVVEVIEGLDLSAMSQSYRGTGSASYHPKLLLGILVYGYATGVVSSRKLEQATYDSVAFRFIAANDHPDHDTIAAFRRPFLPRIEALFVQVLLLARELGLLQLGTVALDGTKVQANASRHSALSYEHAGLRARGQDRGAAEGRNGRADGQGRSGGPGGPSRRDVDPRRTGAPRGPTGPARRGAGEDRGAGARAVRARAGGGRGQTGGPRGQGRDHRQEAWRPRARAADRDTTAGGPDQSGRRGKPDHAGGGRWFRAMLQRPGGGHRGQSAGAGHGRGAGPERQAATPPPAPRARRRAPGARAGRALLCRPG